MIVEQGQAKSQASRRERMRAMMYDDILTAAREIVQQGGIKELSMRALGRAGGVTAPTLYDYFPSKDAVLNALYLEAVKLLRAKFDAAVEANPPGGRRLSAIAHAYREFAEREHDLFVLIFSKADPSFSPGEEQREAAMGLMIPVRNSVIEAIELGELRPCDPDSACRFLWTAVHGFVVLQAQKVLEKCGPEELDMMFEQNLEFIRGGLVT
ncbi:MAG: TetR/AcrR family transcriptional regulator [Thermomicrobiales bacterium]|nr:TetR/AcrR family transcriptional regulator [Thermomicrobiales bacterium]